MGRIPSYIYATSRERGPQMGDLPSTSPAYVLTGACNNGGLINGRLSPQWSPRYQSEPCSP